MNNVSVIIINYNSSEYTINCINSIIDHTNKELKYDIIIIDNNSQESDYQQLYKKCKEFDKVKLVRSNINLGFAGGNMYGAKFASSEYLFFLNNDTVLLNDCLTILHKFMKNHSNVGLSSAQMYNSDNTYHSSFNYFPTLSLKILGGSILRLFKPERYPDRDGDYSEPLKVDLVTGAAMFVDYSKFMEVGGFDTNLFLYCEEEDLAMKMKLASFDVYVVPEAKFIHFTGKSTKRNFDIEKEFYISFLYYQRKYSSFISYTIMKILYFLKTLRKTYKHKDYFKLAMFILKGANMKYSLKHKQKNGNLKSD